MTDSGRNITMSDKILHAVSLYILLVCIVIAISYCVIRDGVGAIYTVMKGGSKCTPSSDDQCADRKKTVQKDIVCPMGHRTNVQAYNSTDKVWMGYCEKCQAPIDEVLETMRSTLPVG